MLKSSSDRNVKNISQSITVFPIKLPSLSQFKRCADRPITCSHSMPLEKGNSEVYRQREARAARLASEIESSLQYRRRVSLENDEGRCEEDKYSSVVREREDRTSPGFPSSTR